MQKSLSVAGRARVDEDDVSIVVEKGDCADRFHLSVLSMANLCITFDVYLSTFNGLTLPACSTDTFTLFLGAEVVQSFPHGFSLSCVVVSTVSGA